MEDDEDEEHLRERPEELQLDLRHLLWGGERDLDLDRDRDEEDDDEDEEDASLVRVDPELTDRLLRPRWPCQPLLGGLADLQAFR